MPVCVSRSLFLVVVFVLVGAAVWGGGAADHPYAHTPAGTREDVTTATLEQCHRFYSEYYQPRNVHLVVVGPVDGPATRAKARATFAGITAGGATAPDVVPLLGCDFPKPELELVEDVPPVESAVVVYLLPPAGSAEHRHLEILARPLSGSQMDSFRGVGQPPAQSGVRRHRLDGRAPGDERLAIFASRRIGLTPGDLQVRRYRVEGKETNSQRSTLPCLHYRPA
ncbi:MAG: insulinase family protein [bacterium]|nr:insulinase family protein [bacterium]